MSEKRVRQLPGMSNYLLSSASISGRSHRIWQQNCHDVAITGHNAEQEIYWGVVLDGCGSKTEAANGRIPSDNEVGAKVSGQFYDAWWQQHSAEKAHQPLASLFTVLYQDYRAFLEQLLDLFPWSQAEERAIFCASHLLCTVVGFVATPTEAAFFWRGDGYLCHDGRLVDLSGDNRPMYPAYELLSGHEEKERFSTLFLNRKEVTWLAVASDGWRPALLAELAQPRESLVLQRWLNVKAQERDNFEDDGAVAAFYLGDRELAIEHGQANDDWGQSK